MSFWGSTIDASKAKTYQLPSDDSPLPPVVSDQPSSTVDSTNTKTHPKPTAGLPGDHGEAEGEADKGAFETATPSMTPTPDEGWFPSMSKLETNQKWFFGAAGAVVIFGISAGIYFWRRRVNQRKRANYSSLAGDDVAMSTVSRDGRLGGGGTRTKELYDAFGEVSDDEDADEETGLRPRGPGEGSPSGRLSFHSGFLDDDEPSSAATPMYRDEPDEADRIQKGVSEDRSASPATLSGDGSGDGSWEHASQTP